MKDLTGFQNLSGLTLAVVIVRRLQTDDIHRGVPIGGAVVAQLTV